LNSGPYTFWEGALEPHTQPASYLYYYKTTLPIFHVQISLNIHLYDGSKIIPERLLSAFLFPASHLSAI
jgi:hypothetical protein